MNPGSKEAHTVPEFDDRLIADFRASNGRGGAWRSDLVLIHHRGVRTGTERVNPAMSGRDGDDWPVVGSAAGSPVLPVIRFTHRSPAPVADEILTP